MTAVTPIAAGAEYLGYVDAKYTIPDDPDRSVIPSGVAVHRNGLAHWSVCYQNAKFYGPHRTAVLGGERWSLTTGTRPTLHTGRVIASDSEPGPVLRRVVTMTRDTLWHPPHNAPPRAFLAGSTRSGRVGEHRAAPFRGVSAGELRRTPAG